jgi:hypothetical protein
MAARSSVLFVFWLAVLAPARAKAVQIGDPDQPSSVEIHAFASQGFLLSSGGNNYIDANSSHGTAQFSEIGINFTKNLGDRLRFGVQLDADDFGTTGSYAVTADWFYADYRFADWLGLRFGRVKIPFGLYNEFNDIDSARTFVLLPQSIYPQQDRNFLLAQTGGELYGYLRMGDAGALEYRAYGGTIFINNGDVGVLSPYQITGVNTPFLLGGRLLWETPLEGLRVGGSVQTLRFDLNLSLGTTAFSSEIPATLWVASLEYAAHDLKLAAEYSRWYVKEDSTNAALFPNAPLQTSERG